MTYFKFREICQSFLAGEIEEDEIESKIKSYAEAADATRLSALCRAVAAHKEPSNDI